VREVWGRYSGDVGHLLRLVLQVRVRVRVRVSVRVRVRVRVRASLLRTRCGGDMGEI